MLEGVSRKATTRPSACNCHAAAKQFPTQSLQPQTSDNCWTEGCMHCCAVSKYFLNIARCGTILRPSDVQPSDIPENSNAQRQYHPDMAAEVLMSSRPQHAVLVLPTARQSHHHCEGHSAPSAAQVYYQGWKRIRWPGGTVCLQGASGLRQPVSYHYLLSIIQGRS